MKNGLGLEEGELVLQVLLILWADSYSPHRQKGMLGKPRLMTHGVVIVFWRNCHLSPGQYLPIMLQARGRC